MWRRELGVRVTLVNEELKSTEEARRAGAYDLLRSSEIAEYADPSAFLEIWRADSGNNFTGWSNAGYDALLFAAARTADPAARNGLYARAERILLSEAPVIPLYHYTHVFLIQPSVRGWSPTLLDHHPYRDVWLGDCPAAPREAPGGAGSRGASKRRYFGKSRPGRSWSKMGAASPATTGSVGPDRSRTTTSFAPARSQQPGA